ncbi:MAG: helix-turn-helix transcriptional regulator [Chloroflexota bacterium]
MATKFSAQKLAELVRGYRDKNMVTLRKLADLTETSTATLSRIEHKTVKTAPDTQTLLRLMDICGFTLEDIFQSDDDAGNSQIHDISTQLHASKHISAETMQALEAVIRAVRLQFSADGEN